MAALSVLIYLPILYLRVPQTQVMWAGAVQLGAITRGWLAVFPLQATGDVNNTNRNGSRR